MLHGKVDVEIAGFELAPGVWVGEGAEIDPDAKVTGPAYVGSFAKVEAGAEVRELTVLGSNVVVKGGAFLERAVVHDNVFVGPQAVLRGCVIGKNTDVMRAARVEEGAVVGDECVVEEEAYLSSGVKVYPFKTIEAGAVVNTSVIWESRGTASLFGPRGVSGLVNVEVTPEYVVRLASAYATTLKKGSVVTTARDASRAARAFKRAVIAALTSSAIDVRDLEVSPLPVTRFETRRSNAAGGRRAAHHPGRPAVDRHRLPRRGRRRPVAGRPAPARAGASAGRSSGGRSPARSPSSASRRARSRRTARTCCGPSTCRAWRRPGSRSSSTPPAARPRWSCRPCSAGSGSTC